MQAISHAILKLSAVCAIEARCVVYADYADQGNGILIEIDTHDGSEADNPNLAATLFGVKFDETDEAFPLVISFDSVKAAVYGDFYTKGGSQTNGWQAQKSGITRHATSNDVLDFVARPDTISVSEASTLGLLGLGFVGLGIASRRRRQKK